VRRGCEARKMRIAALTVESLDPWPTTQPH